VVAESNVRERREKKFGNAALGTKRSDYWQHREERERNLIKYVEKNEFSSLMSVNVSCVHVCMYA
jgi:hypothetical protein